MALHMNQSVFPIATHNDEIDLCGVWRRFEPMDYVVFDKREEDTFVQRFDKYDNALAFFNGLIIEEALCA